MSKNQSRGKELELRLMEAITALKSSPQGGSRELPMLSNILANGTAIGSLENALCEAEKFVLDSGRVYCFGNDVVLSVGGGESGRLVNLAAGGCVESTAPSLLANIFLCESGGGDHQPGKQYAPPAAFLANLLNREPTRARLPQIKTYARKPVFDSEFRLCGPGYHPAEGILVHGIDFDPVVPEDAPNLELPAVERLPPYLRQLLGGFCFAEAADLANALASLVTGLLGPKFVAPGKAIVLVDGNQPGIGKTLLMRSQSVVLDGVEPILVRFCLDDEELSKKICAELRKGDGKSVLLLDNAKVRAGKCIDSPVLEANCIAAEISLRILGQSATLTRPNDLVWSLTMNGTQASPDLVSRGMPVRLRYEGPPEDRKYASSDPLEFARRHRRQILAELAGMVVKWNQVGRPRGKQPHRCSEWAAVVGGILDVAGFPEFLTNFEAAAGAFNRDMDQLAALAEVVVQQNGPVVFMTDGESRPNDAPAADWEKYFRSANVEIENLDAAKSQRSKETTIGNLLGKMVGREVPISVQQRNGRAKLLVKIGRSKRKQYWIAVSWDEPEEAGEAGSDKPVILPLAELKQNRQPRPDVGWKTASAAPIAPMPMTAPGGWDGPLVAMAQGGNDLNW